MNELRELYQEVILDHNRRPRNKGHIESPTHTSDGYNPLCGDQIHLELDIRDGVIEDVKFDGHGCAISTASASLMTQAVKGKTVEEGKRIFHEMQSLLTSPGDNAAQIEEDELMALSGVREYPVRIKCAVLAWHALKQALEGGGKVSTE